MSFFLLGIPSLQTERKRKKEREGERKKEKEKERKRRRKKERESEWRNGHSIHEKDFQLLQEGLRDGQRIFLATW